jgi:hypothetical protein
MSPSSGCRAYRKILKEEMVLVTETIEFFQKVSEKDL